MKLKHLHLHAHIRAICTFSFCITLLLLFPQKAAAWSELLVKGSLSGNDNWTTIATLTQGSDANTWSGTIDASSWKSNAQLSFKLYDSKDDKQEYWWGNGGTADMTTNSSATLYVNANGDNMTLKHSTDYSSYTLNCTFSDNSWTITITGVKSSSGGGGGTTTSANQPGIYLYGQNFGSTDPNNHLTYKFLRKNDSEYHFALYAGSMNFSVEKYGQNRTKTDITPSWNNWQFKIAYIDADGNVSTFCPSSNYTLTNTDGTASTSKEFGNNTQWTIQDNGGMYDLVVKVDANGKPTSWYYESDPNRIVSYKASSTSNWTTEGFLYCLKNPNTEATAYCNNFFGTVPMVKDEEFKFITGNYWLGLRNDQGPYGTNVAISGDQDAPNLKSPYDGIYPIEYNLTRTTYQLAGDDKTPLRIFMIGSALNNNLSNTFTDWDPADAVELVYDSEEQCYKGTVSLAKNGEFRFLRDTNTSGSATSLKLNFGEDSNKPGNGGDTDDNNHVAYNDDSSKGTNVVFNPETNTYNVRFYIEAGTGMSSFSWNSAKYRYTIELPTRLSTTITPPTATVAYGASLTPKVDVNDPDNGPTRTYAYTTDGSDPTIDPTNGEAKGTTKIVTYTPDAVIPTSDLGTFYMAPGNVLTFIDNEGNTSTLTGNKVTVKAQAVQTVTEGEGSKYRLDGNVATGNYTFETAGVQPGSSYTISVTNNETISVNKATATVTVTNKTTGRDDDVDVYYTTDGNNPLESTSARLVRDRKVTVYALPGEVGNAGTIKVAIPGTTASASCTYDITYSTSEGGYQNYLNNNQNAKTLGGQGHVIVYVKPSNTSADTYVYAYENVTGSDGTTTAKLMTPKQPGRKLTDADKTTVNGETWYYLDGETSDGFKEINLQLSTGSLTGYVTVANICHDVFLEFNTSTGVITDVTPAHAGDYFYSVGTDGTKAEAANPTSASPFIYVQVPSEWASGNVTVKLLDSNDKEISGATYTKQDGAETSANSVCYKISGLSGLTDGTTTIKFAPYNTSISSYGTVANHSFSATYKNGGYYYYESQSVNGLGLVFSPADTKTDVRSKGHHDINHVTTGDKTFYLANSWTYSPETESKTASITDNWNKAASATVNVIPTGTTISQTVTGLTAGKPYTVQMIVRGAESATGKMTLSDGTNSVDTTATFSGYTAAGTITTDGRVEFLLHGTNNGWQKLERTITPSGTSLTISLAATNAEMELSDVTLLENANHDGYVWTTAPTNNKTTEYYLTDRTKANAFSFFDRGDNKNAIIYANANTVLGMSENTYDVAVSNGSTYTMHKLALTDAGTSTADQRTSSYTFGVSKTVTTKRFAYDRSYKAGIMSSFCLPVALTKSQLQTMGVATVYEYKGLKVEKGKDTEVQFTEHDMSGNDDFSTTAGMPYIVKFTSDGSFSATSSDEMTVSGTAGKSNDGVFNGNYGYTTLRNANANNPTLFFYSASGSNYGKFVPAFSDKEGTHMKSFRGYFDFFKYTSSAKRYVFSLIGNGSTTTGINTVDDVAKSNHGPIYSVNGQLVSKDGDYSRLPKGIYIQNNHKFVIK